MGLIQWDNPGYPTADSCPKAVENREVILLSACVCVCVCVLYY